MVDVLARGVGIATTGEIGIGRRFGGRHRAPTAHGEDGGVQTNRIVCLKLGIFMVYSPP